MARKVVSAKFQLKGWNTNQLRMRVPVILTQYGQVMDKQLKDEIDRVQFEWPRQTRRRNKTVVGSPRNIVDTGKFKASQRRDRPSATTLLFTWDVRSKDGFAYAPLILTGYTTNKGTVVPGRNWIKPALEAIPLDRFFAEQWRKLAAQGM